MSIKKNLRLFMLPLKKIHDAFPMTGRIYEIGSGFGVIGLFLAELSNKRTIIEIDKDKKKLSLAKSQAKMKNILFEHGDALTYSYKPCQGAILSDFLHHLKYDEQVIVLKKISRKLATGGVLVVKEIDKNDGLLMHCSRIWDFVFYPNDKIYYRSVNDWKKVLRDLHLKVKVSREVRWFPGSTHLFICKKV